MAGGMKG
jgi:hypothetical protein